MKTVSEKTLIIHPKDESTRFLEIVYSEIPGKTVITGGVAKDEVITLIESYDRIMMMGHGTPMGLFSCGQFKDNGGYIIDLAVAAALKKKKESVFIWCNADKYVLRHRLKGFYTGMFISEVGEAYYCGLNGTSQEIVDQSNTGFCKIISKHINKNTRMIYENVMKEYGLIAELNPVAKYNHERLYKR